MSGKVRLMEDHTVEVISLSIQDEELYRFLAEVDEDKRVDRLISALRVGVIGLKRMAIGGEMDFVEKGFNSLVNSFNKMFDPDIKTSHLGKLLSLLGEYFDRGGVLERLFDPADENKPLGRIRKEIREGLQELRDLLKKEKGKQEAIELSPQKGYAFEDICEEILSELVSKYMGDELHRTATEIGEISDSKKGDFVITLGDERNKRIVLETKDVGSITQPVIITSLEEAMENRSAQYGIFVAKYREALPKKVGWFNEYRGNMLVCALGSKEANTFFPEVLNIAYQWARMRVKQEILIEEKALKIIAEGINEIGSKLDRFTQIQKQCTNLDKATNEIRTLSNEIRSSIAEQIDRITEAIAAVSKEFEDEKVA